MRTYLDCIPCFFRQSLEAARLAGADEVVQKKIVDELSKEIPKFSLSKTPPEMGRTIYRLVKEITGKEDPFKEKKEECNRFALSLYPELKERVRSSHDRLQTAIRFAIAGNVIDYGSQSSFDIETELAQCLEKDFAVFNYDEFKRALNGKHILYLADNAGETLFDRILLEEMGCNVTYVVKEKPIINDALMDDARACGIDKIAKVVSSGTDAPGTILSLCSSNFLTLYDKAELIISKGQGNYEALQEEGKNIFFLFKAKCKVVAKDIGCSVGDMILLGRG